jgi:NAD(P)-dependent dehydrogenase (short-subunit alcohol dehydrogenase family)
MTNVLDGKRAVVVGGEQPVGSAIAKALKSVGAEVATVAPPESLDERAAFEQELSGVAERLGGSFDVFVYAYIEPRAREAVPFEDVDDESFAILWERTMQSTIAACQGAFAHMRDRGGRIVLVTPTISMIGAAPGFAAYAAAVEGQRLFAKSAARMWGKHGITVNCVAPAPDVFGVPSPDTMMPDRPLGGIGDPETDLGPLVALLASDLAHFVTGATISADGGSWMGT